MARVTLFKSIHDTDRPYHVGIEQALERIQSGSSKDKVLTFRETKEREHKMSLPITLWSGAGEHSCDRGVLRYLPLMHYSAMRKNLIARRTTNKFYDKTVHVLKYVDISRVLNMFSSYSCSLPYRSKYSTALD